MVTASHQTAHLQNQREPALICEVNEKQGITLLRRRSSLRIGSPSAIVDEPTSCP
jgi:hypothetical protein